MNNLRTPIPNAPNLRFPEFTGEWKEISIGKCCSPLEYGMNAPAKEFDGVNKYIRITDIDEETLLYKKDNIVSPDSVFLEKKYIVKKGDILWARTGASTGKAYLYDEKDGLMYFAGFLIRGNVKATYNSTFVFLQMLTQKYRRWVDVMSVRSGQPGINTHEFSSYTFKIPHSKQEQDKIASFFSLLDVRIQAQIGAIEKLESLIKASAANLTQCDRQVRLSDCLECHTSTLQEKDVAKKGIYPVYGASGIYGYTDQPMCTEPAILIVKDGSGVGSITFAEEPFSVLGTLNYLTAKNSANIRYLYCCLLNFDFMPYKTGMAIPHIYFKDYGKGKISWLDEPKRGDVPNLIFSIKSKLNIEKQLLGCYKAQKQYLLSQMFI